MTIHYITSTTTGVDATASFDTWLLRDGYVLSNTVDAFDFLGFNSADLVVEGSIYSESDGIDSNPGSSGNAVRVMSTGVVYGASDGIEMSGNNHTVINSGEVTGLSDGGIQIFGDNGHIFNSGLVYGFFGLYLLGNAGDVSNTGTVTAGTFGIYLDGDNGNVSNTGTVTAEVYGIYVVGNGNEVANTGTISGGSVVVAFTTMAGEANSLINSGTILTREVGGTAVRGNFGDETIVNTGQIIGDVDLHDGNDVFDNRGGSVLGEVLGGLGDDTFILDDASLQIVENAGEGTDEVRSSVNYALGDNLENLTLLGADDLRGRGNEGANFIDGNAGDNVLNGLEGNDTLLGEAGLDTLRGGEGNDSLRGMLNDDWLTGENGDDKLAGGNGNDTLLGGDGEDSLYGQLGNDDMQAGNQSDYLSGAEGNDTLSGGGGFDTLVGGAGDDVMTGDFNADRFVFSDGYGNDTITDFDANNNAEKIDLRALASIIDFADLMGSHATQVGSSVVIDGGSGDVLTLLHVNLADLDAIDFIF